MYQSRPPDRGDVVLKAPNMILLLSILMLHLLEDEHKRERDGKR